MLNDENPRKVEELMSTYASTDEESKEIGPKYFETVYNSEHTFPFFESGDTGDVFGFGHQDKEEFARLVNVMDTIAQGDSPEIFTEESDVKHLWAVPIGFWSEDDVYFSFRGVDENTPNAFPLTMVQR